MSELKQHDVVQENGISKVVLKNGAPPVEFANYTFGIFGHASDSNFNTVFVIRCIKADPLGRAGFKWHVVIHQSDLNDAKTLYKKMNYHNARTIKDNFINGNLHLYISNLVSEYVAKVMQNDGGQSLILAEMPGVVYSQDIGGYIYVVSDEIKLPMSLDCNLQKFTETKIIWQNDDKKKRYMQTGISDDDLKIIGQDFLEKISQYAGPNMATVLMIMGYCDLNFMRRFPPCGEYQLGICSLFGQGETGKTSICDCIACIFPLRKMKDGSLALEKENELSLGKFAELIQSNRTPLFVDQPTPELKAILDNAYEDSLRETLRSKNDVEVNTLCVLNWGDDYQNLSSFTFSEVTKTLWVKNIKTCEEDFDEDKLLEIKSEIKKNKLRYSSLFKLLVRESDAEKLSSDIQKYIKMLRNDVRNKFEKVPARINEIYAQAIAGAVDVMKKFGCDEQYIKQKLEDLITYTLTRMYPEIMETESVLKNIAKAKHSRDETTHSKETKESVISLIVPDIAGMTEKKFHHVIGITRDAFAFRKAWIMKFHKGKNEEGYLSLLFSDYIPAKNVNMPKEFSVSDFVLRKGGRTTTGESEKPNVIKVKKEHLAVEILEIMIKRLNDFGVRVTEDCGNNAIRQAVLEHYNIAAEKSTEEREEIRAKNELLVGLNDLTTKGIQMVSNYVEALKHHEKSDEYFKPSDNQKDEATNSPPNKKPNTTH